MLVDSKREVKRKKKVEKKKKEETKSNWVPRAQRLWEGAFSTHPMDQRSKEILPSEKEAERNRVGKFQINFL